MEKELRILMVEDVPTDAELEIRELRRAGLRVAHQLVETEEAFREALREFQPELIISDFSMPHFDGMWALALARELVPDVPFIFVSGTIGEEYAIRALKNGATDYVLKNNLVRLPAAVERSLQDKNIRDARRKAEAETAHQRAFLRQVIDLDRNFIFAKNREGRFTLVNQAVAQAYGTTVEGLVGKTDADFNANKEEVEHFRKLDLEVMDTLRETFIPEERITDAGGRVRWLQTVKRPLVSADGKADMVLGVATDITERKRNEEALRESEYRLDLALQASDLAVWDWDIATGDVRFSRHWWPILGHEPGDIPERVEAWRKLTHPEDLARVYSALAAHFKGSVPLLDVEYRMQAKNGKWRWIRTVGRVVERDAAGRALRQIGTHGDITERKEQELRIARLTRIHQVLSGINSAIVRIRDRQELFEEACRIAVEHGGFGIAWIGMLEPQTLEIIPVASAGIEADSLLSRSRNTASPDVPQGQGVVGRAIREKRAVFSNDLLTESTPGGERRKEAIRRGYRAVVALPLLVEEKAVGSLSLFAGEANFFDEEEINLLVELAGDISYALQSIAQQEKVEYLSCYDPVTGLPNRTLFNDRLEQRVSAARHDRKTFAVMTLDLERFRNVNETLGRTTGDDLLRQVGQRLKNALVEPDILAHMGGDHFAMAIQGVDEEGSLGHFLEKILTTGLAQPFEAGGNELRLAARAGVALYPEDGSSAESLLGNAEAALNKAKASGERYLFYQPRMNADVAHTLLLENKLRRALEKEQFVLHYQPKVDLAKGTVIGLEALIRWNDPETGLVPPMRFIPLLEETGMILDAGRWAVCKALEDCREWRARGLQPPRIAVNVSPIQLRQKNFVDVVRDAIGESPAGSPGLDLEITESLIMEDIEGNIGKLRAVRDMGVDIAIDDFGTGYSSLGYLAKLPVNALKIDRSFIITMTDNADSMSIVSAIISLAHSLKLKVIAEGVDSEEQRNLLKLLKCNEMQGYLFSRPLPAAELEAKFLGAAAAT